MRINERRSLWRRLRPYFTVFDGPLTFIILMLLTVSSVTLYSASIGIPGKMEAVSYTHLTLPTKRIV